MFVKNYVNYDCSNEHGLLQKASIYSVNIDCFGEYQLLQWTLIVLMNINYPGEYQLLHWTLAASVNSSKIFWNFNKNTKKCITNYLHIFGTKEGFWGVAQKFSLDRILTFGLLNRFFPFENDVFISK